jgi:hypothetical protein
MKYTSKLVQNVKELRCYIFGLKVGAHQPSSDGRHGRIGIFV